MTKPSGRATAKRTPASETDGDGARKVAGPLGETGEEPSAVGGETSDADPCTAHDRAS